MKFALGMTLASSIATLGIVALLIITIFMSLNIRSTIEEIQVDVTAMKTDVAALSVSVEELGVSVEELKVEAEATKVHIAALVVDVASLDSTTQVISDEVNRGQSRFRQILSAVHNNEESAIELHRKLEERSVVVVDADKVNGVVEELVQRCVFGAMMQWPDGSFTFVAPYFDGGQPPTSAGLIYICSTEDGAITPYVTEMPKGAILDNPEALLWVLDPNSQPEPEIVVPEADGTVFN